MGSPFVVSATKPAVVAAPMAVANGVRVAGYVLDVIPAVFLSLVGLIPVVGPIMAGLLLAPYWLLRDVFGASLGKLLLGLRIVQRDGQPARTGARIFRNLPLTVGPACLVIPILGYIVAPPVAGIMVLVEGILVLSQGSRLGDRLAGTVVVKR